MKVQSFKEGGSLLTTEQLQRFRGGQMKIRGKNLSLSYYCRGEIATIEMLNDNRLQVTFAWMARGEPPEEPKRWFRSSHHWFLECLNGDVIVDIGPGRSGGGNRLLLKNSYLEQVLVLYPPDGDKLDYAEVKDPDL